jgi:hypothetical protein
MVILLMCDVGVGVGSMMFAGNGQGIGEDLEMKSELIEVDDHLHNI